MRRPYIALATVLRVGCLVRVKSFGHEPETGAGFGDEVPRVGALGTELAFSRDHEDAHVVGPDVAEPLPLNRRRSRGAVALPRRRRVVE